MLALCVYKGRDDHPAYAISNACSAAHSRRYKCLHLACAGRVIVGTASLLLPCPEPVVPTSPPWHGFLFATARGARGRPLTPPSPDPAMAVGGGSDCEQ